MWLDHSNAPPGTCMDGKVPAQQGDFYLCTFILGQVTGSSGFPDFTCHTGKISLKAELGGISLSFHAVSPSVCFEFKAGAGKGPHLNQNFYIFNSQSFDLSNLLPLKIEDEVKFSTDVWKLIPHHIPLALRSTHLSGGNNEIYDKSIYPFLRECARNENKSASQRDTSNRMSLAIKTASGRSGKRIWVRV